MLGEKQKEVLAAFNATAENVSPKDADYQTAIAAASRETRSGAAVPPPKDISGSEALIYQAPANPLIAHGADIKVVGNPNRFRGTYAIQNGETCALATARQVLSEFGVTKSEDELYDFALSHGYYAGGGICNKPNKGDWCDIFYDPPTGGCVIHLTINGVDTPGPSTPGNCKIARQEGGTGVPTMGTLFTALSGRRFTNNYTPFKGIGRGMAFKRKQLESARDEVVRALTEGKAVVVSLHPQTLWKSHVPSSRLHTVVVTAVELNSKGQAFAFYLNDTSRLGSYAKRVTAADFDAAWLNDNLHRMYLQ
jgi:hypothetical protein